MDAAGVDGGVQSTQVCLAPIAQHVCAEETRRYARSPLDAWPDPAAGGLCLTTWSKPQCGRGVGELRLCACLS